MRIGIITYYDVPNYGSALLSYSMDKILKQTGHEAVFLKYKRRRETNNPRHFIARKMRGFTFNALRAAAYESAKVKGIASFREQYLSIGDYYDVPQDLDLIIVGSDQIFDCKYEFSPYQFAVNAPCSKVVSYAPSFGEFEFGDLSSFEHSDKLKEALCRFTAHSARDGNTAEILAFLTGKQVETVLDPVLLYGFEEEKTRWNQKRISEPYLIVYTWGGYTVTSEFRRQVCDFAKRNALKTVSVGDFRPWCDYNFASADPVTFFELFQHCRMVITNMFHGTCFSILAGKPFYTLLMKHNRNKAGYLLKSLNFPDQGLERPEELEGKGIPCIDYSGVYALLEQKRQESRRYLEDTVNMKGTK